MSDRPAGWEPDPNGKHDHRYWDGAQWTDHVADAGVASTDAYEPGLVAPSTDADGAATVTDATVTDATVTDATVTDATVTDATVVSPTAPVWPTAPVAPAAPMAPGAPAPPPPYVPTEMTETPDGSRRRLLMVGGGILAAVLVVVAVMALGGGDHADTSQLRADLAARFSAESDISYAQAACKADIYLSDLGAGAFTNIDVSDPGSELPANLTDKVTAADTRATDECNISAAELSGTTSTTDGSAATSTTPTTGFSIGTPGSIPPNVEQLLADVYQQTFHLPQKKAQCLAHALAGALQDGSVTQAELTSGALQFLADCDITLEEIGAN